MKMKAFSTGVASVVLAFVGATSQIEAVAQEAYFTHPASCVAPFLSQAQRMRWHEHFLINPPDGQRTWAVCPINMYINDLATSLDPRNYLVQVYLQHTSDAVMLEPLCFFTGHSVHNELWGSYIDGEAYTYRLRLTVGAVENVAVAQGVISVADIVSAFPPAIAQGPFHIAAYCRLDPGWGINGVEFIEIK